MKLNYILSDTNKSATTSALRVLTQKAENNVFSDFIVLVPETKSVIIEKELLELSGSGAFANIFVYSFVRLINRMGFVSSDKIVTKQTCVLLLKKIIYDNIESLKCYKKTAKTLGFAEKIYDTIAQFKSSGVSAEDLELSLSTKSESLKAKLKDIVFLYKEYEKVLGNGLFDDLDKLAQLKNFAKTSEFIKNAEIFVVGFDNITYEMQSVLKELAKNAKEITFSSVFFGDKRCDKHIQSNELYLKFKHIADELKYPYIPTFFNSAHSGDFYNIKNHLFSLERKTVEPKGSVQIFEAKNKSQEIEFVATSIIGEVQSGKRFKDMAVYANGLQENLPVIEKVFKNFNIPFYVRQEYNLLEHFYVKFISSVFACKLSHLSYEKVLEVISNAIFGENDYSTFHNFVFETGLNHNAFTSELDERFSERADFLQVKLTLEKFSKFYKTFDEKIKISKTISDFVAVIDFVNEYFNISEKLETYSEFEAKSGLDEEAEITSKIFGKVSSFNESLVNFLGGLSVSTDEFVQIYFSGFSSVKLNLSPATIDSVIIDDSIDAFFDIKDLFVVDAVEGKFPTKIQDSGIILDSELEDAKNILNKPIEPTTKQINARENFKVYETLLEPKEKLFVTFSTKNLDGAITKPSRIVLKLLNLFGEGIKSTEFEEIEFVNYKHFEEKFAKDIGRFYSNQVLGKTIKNEYLVIQNNLSKPFENYIQNIGKIEDFELSDTSGLYFFGDKTSISQLEKYFDCPYKFFANYGLRLKENKNFKANSIDIGNIIHRLAELFVKDIAQFESLKGAEFEKAVENILTQAIEELEINQSKNKALIKFMKAECVRLCEYLVFERQNSGFKTKDGLTEFEFKGENAVVLNLNDGSSVRIEGKIDRVDEFGDYVRIIDYKTGSIKSDLSAVYFGNKIQLVSYLLAIQKLDGKKVAGLFYFPIHSDFATTEKIASNMYKLDGFMLHDIDVVKNMDYTLSFDKNESNFVPLKIKTGKEQVNENRFEISGTSKKYMSSEEFDNIKGYVVELCKQAVCEIESGYIEPSPSKAKGEENPATCKWCKFAGVCGLDKSKHSIGRTLESGVTIDEFKNISKEEA